MTGQRIGYVRVSTLDQNTARQLEGVDVDQVFAASPRPSDRRPRAKARGLRPSPGFPRAVLIWSSYAKASAGISSSHARPWEPLPGVISPTIIGGLLGLGECLDWSEPVATRPVLESSSS